jgi:hypothetical protein
LAGGAPEPSAWVHASPVLAIDFILTREVYYSSHEEPLGHRIAKPVRLLCERDIYISHSLLRTYQTHSAADEIKLYGGLQIQS